GPAANVVALDAQQCIARRDHERPRVDEARGAEWVSARRRCLWWRAVRGTEDSLRHPGVVFRGTSCRRRGGSSRARDGDLQFAKLERNRRSLGEARGGDEEVRVE